MKLTQIALTLLLAPLAVAAQAEITFTPFATYQWFDSQKLGDAPGIPDVQESEGYAGALGYRFTPAFGLEAHYGRTETEVDAIGGPDVRDSRLSLDGYYAFNADGKLSPYLLLGAGRGDFKVDGSGSAKDTIVNGAIGAFLRFNEYVALRVEARNVFNSDEDTNDQLALLGLEFSPGSSGKSEPAPEPVAEQAPVEELAAAPAAVVIAPADADSDGVVDDQDQCAGTPAGVQVNSVGCPLDGDRDGVPDYLDKCPTTSAGVMVDSTGCDKMLTEAINLELKVSFDSGKAIVKDEFKTEIAKAAAIMKQYPSAYMEIQGHTDSSGRAAANNALSQQRADAVRAVLVNEYGVAGDHITAKGYGSSQPVADNKTAEGRAKNRRVIAIVTGEAKKVMKK